MNADSKEAAFQQDMIDQIACGWKLGDPAKYDSRQQRHRIQILHMG